MKRLVLCLGLAAASLGCTFHRGGSQAIEFDPFAWGRSDRTVVRPADGWGYSGGAPLDAR